MTALVILIALITLTVFGSAAIVLIIGRPRKPVSSRDALIILVINGLTVAGYVYLWRH